MTIVEMIDTYGGFSLITDRIRAKSMVSLLWIIGTVTFFLSAALDNLTTTIVMVSLIPNCCGITTTASSSPASS
jgi:Na+/H+ antiporter NhaD/arsenite permease-like protein